MMVIPDEYARFIQTIDPAEGVAWLDGLPQLVEQLADTWQLGIGCPFAALSYNFVLAVTQADGTPAVLKIGRPNPELLTEIEALRLYNGRGAARLLAADPQRGALLIERLQPGTMLHAETADDDQATRIAAQLMQQLRRPVPVDHPFPTLHRWSRALRELDGRASPLPTALVHKAQTLLTELLASAEQQFLLHGDLHHYNILRTQTGWQAIDPKGVVGDPYYEPTPLLYNPIGALNNADGKKRLHRRLDILAETLNFDRQRLAAFGFCQCLLSAAWSVEDNTDWQSTIHCATLFERIDSIA